MNTVGLLQRRRNHRSFRVPIARVQGRRRHFISRFILLRKARQKAAARLANTAEASRRESFTTEENTEAAQIDVQDAHAVDDDLQQQPEGKKLSELDAKLRRQQLEKHMLFTQLKKVLRLAKVKAQLRASASAAGSAPPPATVTTTTTAAVSASTTASNTAVTERQTTTAAPFFQPSRSSMPLGVAADARLNAMSSRGLRPSVQQQQLEQVRSGGTTPVSIRHSPMRTAEPGPPPSHQYGRSPRLYLMQGTKRQMSSLSLGPSASAASSSSSLGTGAPKHSRPPMQSIRQRDDREERRHFQERDETRRYATDNQRPRRRA